MHLQQGTQIHTAPFVDVVMVVMLPQELLHIDVVLYCQERGCLFLYRQRNRVSKHVFDILSLSLVNASHVNTLE
jgi:hypothetical protein